MTIDVQDLSQTILKKIKSKSIPDIKSSVGVVNLSCQIVERASKKSKKSKISSAEKQSIAINITKDVVKKLGELNILEKEKVTELLVLFEDAEDFIKETIDDVLSIWNRTKKVHKK